MTEFLRSIFGRTLKTARGPGRRRCCLEVLEKRLLLSVIQVRNQNNSGDYSLRWAIEKANNQVTNPGHDEIVIMDQAPYNVHHIDLQSELPPIWDGVTIRSESGEYVTIDAQDYSQGANDDGLVVSINSGRDLDTWIQDLDFANVTGDTFRLEGVDGQNVTLHHCCVNLETVAKATAA